MTRSEERIYRPDVEGLRAIAILLVVFFHFGVPGFKDGAAGVDVFFVISGFVITGQLMRAADGGRFSLADFFARRCRRIIPVATVVLIVSLFIEWVIGGRAALAAFAQPARWILLFIFNWDGAAETRILLAPNPIGGYWSLGVEEQFYIVYPVLLIGLMVIGRRWSFPTKAMAAVGGLTVASFCWALSVSPHFSVLGYTSTLTRAWELGLGCLLALASPRLTQLPQTVSAIIAWAGLAMILYAGTAFLVLGTSRDPGVVTLLPVGGALLVIAGGKSAPRFGAELLLGTWPARLIGRWSYGMYLWQIPVLLVVLHRWGTVFELPVASRFAFIAITIAVAGLSFRFFESPIRSWRFLAADARRTLLLALGVTVAVLLFGQALVSHLVPQPRAPAVSSTPGPTSPSVRSAPPTPPTPPTTDRPSPVVQPPPTTQPPATYVYVVRPGDTLWALAARYLGNPLRQQKLFALNRRISRADGHTLVDPN